MNLQTLAFFGNLGAPELLFCLIIGLLVFGRRLPEIARSMGKSIVEFKRGMKDVRDDIEEQSRLEPPSTPRIEQRKSSLQGNSSRDQPTGVA